MRDLRLQQGLAQLTIGRRRLTPGKTVEPDDQCRPNRQTAPQAHGNPGPVVPAEQESGGDQASGNGGEEQPERPGAFKEPRGGLLREAAELAVGLGGQLAQAAGGVGGGHRRRRLGIGIVAPLPAAAENLDRLLLKPLERLPLAGQLGLRLLKLGVEALAGGLEDRGRFPLGYLELPFGGLGLGRQPLRHLLADLVVLAPGRAMIGLEAGHRLPTDRRPLAFHDGALLLVAVRELLLRLLVLFLGRAGLGRERGDDLHLRRRPLGHEPVELGQ